VILINVKVKALMNGKLITKFLDKKNVFAVVGASRFHRKYGYQVYEDLRNAGYKFYFYLSIKPAREFSSLKTCASTIDKR
jgi:predicted CoA-binding protein